MLTVEHELEVPLDHEDPDGARLTVFARELVEADGRRDRPWLLFFNGGPGGENVRPRRLAPDGWLGWALERFRVLLLDQRGTGRSTPVGDLPGMDPAAQAAYLTHFRADAIVRDAEALRAALGIERWTVVGQSFGGFCVVRYLSAAPDALDAALITGGLPALGPGRVEEVYERTWAAAAHRTARFFARYPQDRERYDALRARLRAGDTIRLPAGDRLTADRLRAAGQGLGTSAGEERLHHLLELDPGSPAFLHDVQDATGYARNPLYAVLHESCWADGGATGWSAARTAPPGDDVLLGEHVLPSLVDELGALAPLRDAAHLLAEHPWPRLYDEDRLARNSVPAAAIVYADDLYVPRDLSEQTARQIAGLRVWLTNEWEHDGIHVDGARILGRLLDLAHYRA